MTCAARIYAVFFPLPSNREGRCTRFLGHPELGKTRARRNLRGLGIRGKHVRKLKLHHGSLGPSERHLRATNSHLFVCDTEVFRVEDSL